MVDLLDYLNHPLLVYVFSLNHKILSAKNIMTLHSFSVVVALYFLFEGIQRALPAVIKASLIMIIYKSIRNNQTYVQFYALQNYVCMLGIYVCLIDRGKTSNHVL